MAYRNGTYVAFHAGGVTDPTESDIKYYNLLKSWVAHKNIDFTLINSHEKTNAVRDSSSKETLKKALKTRLNNSKHLLLILTKTTKNDDDWVPFEIEYAIDICEIPLIIAYPDFKSILNPLGLSEYWFPSLKDRIENSTAKAIHIPFKKEAISDAINQFGINNSDYPINGYGYYSKEAHQKFGLL